MVEVKFLARLREQLGSEAIAIEFRQGMTAHDIALSTLGAHMNNTILCAVNHAFCDMNTVLSDGDHIAFLPPVTGG